MVVPLITSFDQGVSGSHGGSAIPQLGVTEGTDSRGGQRGELSHCAEGMPTNDQEQYGATG